MTFWLVVLPVVAFTLGALFGMWLIVAIRSDPFQERPDYL